ncbi:cytidylate kinase [Sulfurimicrobium lacus]|uniref:Cytidylate kinase n=1 Tax=Sulfurimicrobium lacus TaxID=2715678 RepID=A0A6F8VA10_9PROT|nr:(d)CMP kinase [Sulfurimicrobium lacus]BCB25836.1 cytidylate kinase [Sulfurimicrobium lacus]
MNASSPLTPHSSPAIPVIAIDGPSASGKGTVAALVAKELGFHYLDSGAIYRVTALAAQRAGIALDDENALAELAGKLDVSFDNGEIWLDGTQVGEAVRTEESGNAASKIASLPRLRAALLAFQRSFRKAPGLVADGRDMGSVVFPDATLKIFLTASAEVRAERRYKQLMEKGMRANLSQILQDLQQRDARDSARSVAPLQKCADASLLDTDTLTIAAAVNEVLRRYQA